LHLTILTIGVMSSLFGLALMARYGVTFHSELEFGGIPAQSQSISSEAWRRHARDLRGRFGLVLAVLGGFLSTGASGLSLLPL
jgi:hypothetical protein